MPRSVRPSPLAGHDILSLDIPEQQVLINLVRPDRAWLGHGFESHVLSVRINGTKWVTSDSDWFPSLFDVGAEGVVGSSGQKSEVSWRSPSILGVGRTHSRTAGG